MKLQVLIFGSANSDLYSLVLSSSSKISIDIWWMQKYILNDDLKIVSWIGILMFWCDKEHWNFIPSIRYVLLNFDHGINDEDIFRSILSNTVDFVSKMFIGPVQRYHTAIVDVELELPNIEKDTNWMNNKKKLGKLTKISVNCNECVLHHRLPNSIELNALWKARGKI